MKLTPAAIRQHSFETAFRGYEKKEVSVFLDEVSEIVDKLHQENMDLKSKLQNTEFEAKRLKDVEDSLFRTLKTAEDTGASIIEEANEAADLIIAEANHTAEHATEHASKIILQARKQAEEQAATLVLAAEKKAKDTILELRENIENLVISYENLAQQRQALVINLKKLAEEGLSQVEQSEADFKQIDATAHLQAIQQLEKSNPFVLANIDSITPEPVRMPESEIVRVLESTQVEESELIESNEEIIISDSVDQLSEINRADEEVVEFETESEGTIEEKYDDFGVEIENKSLTISAELPPKMEEIQCGAKPPEDLMQQTEEIPVLPEVKKNQAGSFFDEFS